MSASLPFPHNYDQAINQRKISNAGRIPQAAFKTSIEVIFGLAVLCVLSRIFARIYTRRRLFLDDCFLIIGLVCLGAGTGLVHVFCQTIFVVEAIKMDPTVVIPPDQYNEIPQTFAILDAFLCVMWTTTFAVKFSFLALFRLLIRRVSNSITTYYWIVVAITTVTWMFLVAEPFILCPYFRPDQQQQHCTPQTPYTLTVALTSFVTCLDVITDIMIASIPIIILRKTQIKASRKVGLLLVLCLSLVMATIAIIRVSGFTIGSASHTQVYDLTWQLYWQYMEGCVACIMASVAAFRSLFVASSSREAKKNEQRPSYSMRLRLIERIKQSRSKNSWEAMSGDEDQLPAIPSATLSGVKTFIRRNNRSAGITTMVSALDPHEENREVGQLSKDQIYVNDNVEVSSNRASLHQKNRAMHGEDFV